MITPQDIQQKELAAQHCDDFTQYKREMAEVERLKAVLWGRRATTQVRNRPSQKRPTGRRTATSVNHAIEMMEGKV